MPIAATERLGNLGYGALKKEAPSGTPVIPNTFFYLYKSTLNTDPHYDEDNPVAGVRSDPFTQLLGLRTHEGALEVLAEPNTAEYFLDMLLAAGNITGGGDPYTHPFTEGLSNTYTLDILKGDRVERYWGVKAEDLECAFDKNKMKFNIGVAAQGSFIVRRIASISTTTITLDTAYDPSPNKGLVATDVVRILAANFSASLDTTVSSVNADGITVVLGASAAAFTVGDYIYLRAQTPSFSTLYPFNWARLEFRFGAGASAALSATQTRLLQGSKWKISHKLDKGNADKSGSYDPANIPRLQTSADLTLKMFYDQPQYLMNCLDAAGTDALVIRHFSGSNHELRLTFNQLRYKMSKRDLDSGKLIQEEITGKPNYSTSDSQAFDVKVLNGLST